MAKWMTGALNLTVATVMTRTLDQTVVAGVVMSVLLLTMNLRHNTTTLLRLKPYTEENATSRLEMTRGVNHEMITHVKPLTIVVTGMISALHQWSRLGSLVALVLLLVFRLLTGRTISVDVPPHLGPEMPGGVLCLLRTLDPPGILLPCAPDLEAHLHLRRVTRPKVEVVHTPQWERHPLVRMNLFVALLQMIVTGAVVHHPGTSLNLLLRLMNSTCLRTNNP